MISTLGTGNGTLIGRRTLAAGWICLALAANQSEAAEQHVDPSDPRNQRSELIEELPSQIVDRGLCFATIEQRSRLRNPVTGEIYERARRIIQLENGLHYLEGNEWLPSEDLIAPTEQGLAAMRGPTKLDFSGNINSPHALRVTTFNGNRFSCQILGLVYSDNGRNVQIAAVKDATATLYPPNQVVYHDAFSGVDADVRYTYTRGAYQVDVVLRGQLPEPEAFGMSSASAMVQLWTEYIDAPEPSRTVRLVRPGLADETLDFGDLWMPTGRAFSIGNDVVRPLGVPAQVRLPDLSDPDEVPITKRWLRAPEGVFMVESVAYGHLASRLIRLAGGTGVRKGAGGVVLNGSTVPRPSVSARGGASPRLASAPYRATGVVMDVVPLSGSTNAYTFRTGETYHISSGFGVGSGVATFESGTVIKFSAGAYLYVYGYVSFPSSAASVPLFTSKDDDLYGDAVSGSSGNPGNAAAQALWIYYPTALAEVKNARFRWANPGLQFDMNPGVYLSHALKDSFFENCATGLMVNLQQSSLTLSNVKKTNVTTEKAGTGTVNGTMSSYTPGATLNTNFAGLSRNDSVNGEKAPPDTQLAVGYDHIVMIAGGGIAIYNKQGQKQADTTLNTFFAVTADSTSYPQGNAGDARVIYDANWGGGRFIACAHDGIYGGNLLLAVSNTNNPYGSGGSGWIESNWKKYVITNSVSGLKPEFPTLGLDSAGIYFWSLRVEGGPNAVAVIKKSILDGSNPPKKLGVILGAGQIPTSQFIHPALNHDSTSPGGYAWFLAEDSAANKILYGRLKWNGDSAGFEDGDSWLSVAIPDFESPISLAPPQSCGLTVKPSRALTHALPVLRNGFLWFCHDIRVNASGQAASNGDRAAIQWFRFQFATNGSTVFLTNQISGRVFDGAVSAPWHYYDGSIAVNSLGHMVIGFSGSKSGTHVGAFYAVRLNHGYLLGPVAYKAGLACYNPETSGCPVPWGDYSATCVDATDSTAFWTAQEYAESQTGSTYPQNARWGTYIGKVTPN